MWKELRTSAVYIIKNSHLRKTIQLLTVWKEVQSITAFEDTWKSSYWWKTFQLFKLWKLSDSSAWKRHERIHYDDKPFSSSSGTRISVSHVDWKNIRIHNNEIHKHEKWEARDWRSMIDSVPVDWWRKLLGEPKWVFLQTIYSRVVFIVTHFAFDKMERIKMTELNSYRHFVVQFYSSKV